ncbi:MAG: hypothetical protein LUG52_08190, partial [Clostridia bacterium]|nr:hypothetical protein [Clostridia bacterium]
GKHSSSVSYVYILKTLKRSPGRLCRFFRFATLRFYTTLKPQIREKGLPTLRVNTAAMPFLRALKHVHNYNIT